VKTTEKILKMRAVLIAVTGFLAFTTLYGQSQFHKEIIRTIEEDVKVRLESAYGNIVIGSGTARSILVADMIVDPSIDIQTDVDYTIDGATGQLRLMLKPPEKQKRGWRLGNLDGGTWQLDFNREIPLAFDIELGAGRGEFDFSGLEVNHLNIAAGASSVVMKFNEANRGYIERIKIESGVSKFTGENLGNANFGELKFEGGVGSYTLDFNGNLRHEADVSVELGLGSVTIIVPAEIGVKLNARQRLFSSVDVPADFTESERNEYISNNYHSARGKLNIKVESGFGSVRLRR
jgi:hypothetical protein